MKNLYFILTLFWVVQNATAIELGSLDTSFNGTGWLAEGSDQVDHKAYGSDVLVDSQGRVIVSGSEEYQDGLVVQRRGRLIRYNGEGQIDTSFGNSGKVNLENNISGAGIVKMSLGENNNIFVAYSLLICSGGIDCQLDVFVKYLDNTGSEISTTSVNFDLQTTFDRKDDALSDILYIADLEKVVIVAFVERIGENDVDFGIASIDVNPNTGGLSLDTSFNSNGKNTCYFDQGGTGIAYGRWDLPYAVAYDVNSQNYIVAGYAQENNGTNGDGLNMAFCEFALNGSLVSKWSTQASSPFVFDDKEIATDIVAVDENGTTILYVSGHVQASGHPDFALGRYVRNFFTGDWELDTTFGSSSGWSYVDFNEFYSSSFTKESTSYINIQADGSILMAGSFDPNTNNSNLHFNFGVAKFSESGILDSNWGMSGNSVKRGLAVGRTNTPYQFDAISSFAVDSTNGAIYICGFNANDPFTEVKSTLIKLHNDMIFANNFDF